MFLYRFGSQIQHLLLDVDCEDFAARADSFRQAPSEIARAGADFRYRRPCWNLQPIDESIGSLFGVTADAVEKIHVRIRMVGLACTLRVCRERRALQRTKVSHYVVDLRAGKSRCI